MIVDSLILQDLRNYLPRTLLLNAKNADDQADLFMLDLTLAF